MTAQRTKTVLRAFLLTLLFGLLTLWIRYLKHPHLEIVSISKWGC